MVCSSSFELFRTLKAVPDCSVSIHILLESLRTLFLESHLTFSLMFVRSIERFERKVVFSLWSILSVLTFRQLNVKRKGVLRN